MIDARSLDAGDVVWIDFGDPVGHEQARRRPAFVVSPRTYNRQSSLLLVCPITRTDRPWPFKVPLAGVSGMTGFVLADQIRSIDPAQRLRRIAGRASPETVAEVRARLRPIIGWTS
jgi:mRNA interferase MazF